MLCHPVKVLSLSSTLWFDCSLAHCAFYISKSWNFLKSFTSFFHWFLVKLASGVSKSDIWCISCTSSKLTKKIWRVFWNALRKYFFFKWYRYSLFWIHIVINSVAGLTTRLAYLFFAQWEIWPIFSSYYICHIRQRKYWKKGKPSKKNGTIQDWIWKENFP